MNFSAIHAANKLANELDLLTTQRGLRGPGSNTTLVELQIPRWNSVSFFPLRITREELCAMLDKRIAEITKELEEMGVTIDEH